MSGMIQVALADDPTEAEQIQALLEEAGIASQVAQDDESDGLKVLVPEGEVDAAQDAIDLAASPDETLPEL
jgi:type III secretory pathway lipoprotein EscJ